MTETRVKHHSHTARGNQFPRGLVAILLALGWVVPVCAQRTVPRTQTPFRIETSLSKELRTVEHIEPKRSVTQWPNDIERALGSIAGSMVGSADFEPASARISDEVAVDETTPAPAPVVDTDNVFVTTPPIEVIPTPPPQVSSAPAVVPSGSGQVYIPPAISHGPMAGQLDSYRVRALELPNGQHSPISIGDSMVVETWWQDSVNQPLGFSDQILAIDVSELTQIALVSSPYVQGILTEPEIRRSDLVIADADFDSLAFVEAKFADTNEPIGSTLTTGALSGRFRDETFSSAAGVRRKTRNGASLEVVQRGGFQDNNSTFLVPNPQGTSRLEINFTQPLMKGRGRAVNNIRVLLAKIDVQLANSEVRGDLEDHLIDVTRAYWDLYQARTDWLQRNRLLEGATRLRDILDARGEVDSLQRQILRAEAAVTSRKSDLVRADARVRNAQAQLRLLTGDQRLIQAGRWELTPQDQPLTSPLDVSIRQATITALDNRPDISQAIRQVQAVSAKVGAAKNQVLPKLDLILSTYVAGLDDKTDTLGAWVNQFSDGRPSYAAGLRFEIPIGNRASRARLNRNRWELSRSLFEFQQTTEVAFTDVEIAVRETKTAFDEMLAKKKSIDAAEREVAYLQHRWELLPDPNESAVLLIEDLLDAQERLADEERALVRAQVAYAMSWVQLRKAMGVLLRFDEPLYPEAGASEPMSDPVDSTESAGLVAEQLIGGSGVSQ